MHHRGLQTTSGEEGLGLEAYSEGGGMQQTKDEPDDGHERNQQKALNQWITQMLICLSLSQL
jgi:hypothetical protein